MSPRGKCATDMVYKLRYTAKYRETRLEVNGRSFTWKKSRTPDLNVSARLHCIVPVIYCFELTLSLSEWGFAQKTWLKVNQTCFSTYVLMNEAPVLSVCASIKLFAVTTFDCFSFVLPVHWRESIIKTNFALAACLIPECIDWSVVLKWKQVK